MQFFRSKKILVMALGVCVIGACASAPPAKPVDPDDQLQFEQSLGAQLGKGFEPHLSFRRDPEVSAYLKKLGGSLVTPGGDPNANPVTVSLIRDVAHRWKSFALPGNRIYLSIGLVRNFEFDAELAAALAYELGHLVKQHVLKRLEATPGALQIDSKETLEGTVKREGKLVKDVEYLGPEGILTYDVEQQLEAVDAAIELLYQAGYDPRGMISLWNYYLKHPERSPFSDETLEKLLERTRLTLALHTPLRNPIVRSDAFLKIKKRIERL